MKTPIAVLFTALAVVLVLLAFCVDLFGAALVALGRLDGITWLATVSALAVCSGGCWAIGRQL